MSAEWEEQNKTPLIRGGDADIGNLGVTPDRKNNLLLCYV